MKIVVGGYIVSFPLGGMTWHHLNYLLGLRDLGHELFFLEDGGEWLLPYVPTKARCVPDSSYGREYLRRTLRDFDLDIPWHYRLDAENCSFGASEDELCAALRGADLMICISGVTALRADRPRPRRTLVIDTDPVFTQLRMNDCPQLIDYYRQFDRVATFGRLIGTDRCDLPAHGFDWIATNQPVSLRHWPVAPRGNDRFTTIGKWEHGGRHVMLDGRPIFSSKGIEWMKMLDLPRRVPWQLGMGMQSMSNALRRQFDSHGWIWNDPEVVSADCRRFGDFVRASAGEFTVAKQIYSCTRSGWFSDRSACYLASGKPVVTQSTGFEQWLPSGKGVLPFETIDGAADALHRVHREYETHARAARRLAEEYFDSRRVLSELIERAM